MDRERNLLFGLLAAQLRRVPATSVASAAIAWESDPTRDLPDRLVDTGALSDDERTMLLGLVDRAIADFGGEADITLDAFGGAVTWTSPPGRRNATKPALDTSFAAVDEYPGRYIPVGEYSRGGMGRILLVRDQHLAREVALKELLPGRAERVPTGSATLPPQAARFIQEARITGRLEHPSIVPIYELGRRADGTLYYTMKLVRGQTLSKAIAEAGGLEQRLRLLSHFLDLCQAIAYAHSCGVIHRDIKSANTMVGEFGETVVIDWGLAKSNDRSDIQAESLTRAVEALQTEETRGIDTTDGKVMGTPVFMAPEQALGLIERVDARSDVYSLGAVLYELLAGAPPFQGGSAKEVIDKVVLGAYAPIATLEPAAPAELIAICARAMANNPDDRYQSSKELADEINRFMSGGLVRSYDYRFREHLKRFARRYRAILTTAAAATLALAALAVFYNVQLVASRDQAETSRLQAVIEKDKAERDNYFALFALADRSCGESQIDQAKDLLANCPARYRNWEWGRLNQLCNLAYQTFRGHTDGINSIAFTPDERVLATASSDGTVRVWDTARGDTLHTLNGQTGKQLAVAISPDGRCAAAAGAQGTVNLWNIDTGALIRNVGDHTAAINALAYSPDGRAIVSAGSDGAARIWDVETGTALRTLVGHLNDITSVACAPTGFRVATASSDDTARVWDGATGSVLCVFKEHKSDVTSITFSADGTSVASGSLDGTVKIWSPESGEVTSTLIEGAPVNAVAFSPDGESLAVANSHNTVTVWHWRPPAEPTYVISGHSGEVKSVAFLAKGHNIATGSEDGAAKLWSRDEVPGQLRLHQPLGNGQFARFTAGADGNHIVAADAEGYCAVWDLRSDVPTARIAVGVVNGLELNTKSGRLLSVRADGAINVWDAASGASITTLDARGCSVVTLNDAGSLLGVGRRDGDLSIYTIPDGAERFHLHGAGAAVCALAFSPDNRFVASGTQDNTVTIWDAQTGQDVRHRVCASTPEAVAFSSGNDLLAIAGTESVVWAFKGDLPPANLMSNNSKGRTLVSVAFSPDGSRIAAGSKDGNVILWDTQTARQLLTMPICHSYVESVCFGPDGSTLTATGWDKKSGDTLVRWDVGNWRSPLRPLSGGTHSEKLRAYLADLARKTPHVRATPDETQSPASSLTPDDLRRMLRECAQLLKTNRDTKHYQGKLFASEGMLIETDPSEDPTQTFVFRKLGFEPGDVVTHINGVRIISYDTAIETLKRADLEKTDALHLEVLRDGKPRSLDFTVTPSPAAH